MLSKNYVFDCVCFMRKYERMRYAIYKCLLGFDVVGDLVKGIRVDQISRGV